MYSTHQGLEVGEKQLGSLVVTFYGTSAYQVGEGKMKGPIRGEVGLRQGPHALAHHQKQLSTLPAHSPSLGQLQAAKTGTGQEGALEGWPSRGPALLPLLSTVGSESQQPALPIGPTAPSTP